MRLAFPADACCTRPVLPAVAGRTAVPYDDVVNIDQLVQRLSGFALFAQANQVELVEFARRLTTRRVGPGEVLMRQGEVDPWFLVVIEGSVSITRQGKTRQHDLGRCVPGSVLGELSMLTGNAHAATVTTVEEVVVAVGDGEAFDTMLHVTGVEDGLSAVTSKRLAESAAPVAVTTRHGLELLFRPLLRSDRDQYLAELDALAPESRRMRFFSAGRPSQRTIDYLININYLDHFAWGVTLADSGRGVATARYVRLADRSTAEVAFLVIDEYQGQGIGTLLLGALAAAAGNAGIETFTAEVLSENRGMRTVFDRAGAVWSRAGSGIVAASFPVSRAAQLLPETLRTELRRSSRGIVTGAGIAKHAHH